MSQQEQPILDSEAIVRIIRQEWLVDGVLQQSAFTLKPQETYLSVNRPAVDTYDADVQSFVSSHASFQFDNGKKYRCASMQVSGVRSIKVLDERNQPLAVEVEWNLVMPTQSLMLVFLFVQVPRMFCQEDLLWVLLYQRQCRLI